MVRKFVRARETDPPSLEKARNNLDCSAMLVLRQALELDAGGDEGGRGLLRKTSPIF